MEEIYNKLVRDKIPEKIISNGEELIIRILSNEEYKIELEKKLLEEYNDVIAAKGVHRLEELADMVEVIKALANLENKDLNDIIELANIKSNKRGAFKDKVFLEKVLKR